MLAVVPVGRCDVLAECWTYNERRRFDAHGEGSKEAVRGLTSDRAAALKQRAAVRKTARL